MTISLYLKRPKADVETVLYAILFFEGHKLKYYTPEKILPKYWNGRSQRARQGEGFRESPEFNERLKNWKADVANLYRRYVNDHGGAIPDPATLKGLLDAGLKKDKPDHSLMGFFQSLIEEMKKGTRLQPVSGKPYTRATIQVYQNTLNHLKAFGAQYSRMVDFSTIDLEFYSDYTTYLAKDLLFACNTIGKDIKTLKAVLHEATDRGLNTNLKYRSRKFSVTSESTNSIYLSEQELRELEALDLSDNPRLDQVRDRFLVGCYTGLRVSDYSGLSEEDIQDGFFEIRQIKTDDPVVIPVHPVVERIRSKYNGGFPHPISTQKLNVYLKELGQITPAGKEEAVLGETASKTITKGGVKVVRSCPKWALLTTHSARRSFATNEYRAGTPTLTIMAITGHKTEKAFLRYIKVTPKEHAELLAGYWQERQVKQELRAV